MSCHQRISLCLKRYVRDKEIYPLYAEDTEDTEVLGSLCHQIMPPDSPLIMAQGSQKSIFSVSYGILK